MTELVQSIITIGTPILTAIGVFVAAYGVMRNTENAKKRATIDMIMAERNNVPLQEAISRVNEMAKTEGCIFATYMSEKEEHQGDRKHILKVLNQREFVSAGVLVVPCMRKCTKISNTLCFCVTGITKRIYFRIKTCQKCTYSISGV